MKTKKLFWNSFYTKLMAFSHILGRGNWLTGTRERRKMERNKLRTPDTDR